jgi:hypothetical protein
MERRAPSFGTAAATAGCLLFMAWVLSPRASAQGAGSAILRGTVMDASGGVLPGATLALTSVRTRATRDAATDAGGTSLPPSPPVPTACEPSSRASHPGRAARSS